MIGLKKLNSAHNTLTRCYEFCHIFNKEKRNGYHYRRTNMFG